MHKFVCTFRCLLSGCLQQNCNILYGLGCYRGRFHFPKTYIFSTLGGEIQIITEVMMIFAAISCDILKQPGRTPLQISTNETLDFMESATVTCPVGDIGSRMKNVFCAYDSTRRLYALLGDDYACPG